MTTKEAVPKSTQPKRNPLDYPTRRFVGFALLLAWHYNLWFLHDAFIGVQLLDDCVTESWLFALVAAVIGFIAIAFALGRKHHLCERKWLYEAVTAIAFASTLVLTLFAFSFPTDAIAYALAAVIGASNALLWIMWGELYSRTKTSFSVARIGTTIGLVMLACSLVALVLPTGVSSVFISLLPVAACVLFRRGRRIAESMPYPTLLPESTAKRAIRPMIVVSVTAFVAALACYFLVAIIPLESLPDGDLTFTFGSIGGAVLLCIIGAVSASSKQRLNIYRIFPWLIILAIISFALFITGEQFYIPSFFLVLAVVAIFEVLLIMYFGVLGMKGYVPIGIAFGFSGAFIRLGIATGNTLALIYEANPSFALVATTPHGNHLRLYPLRDHHPARSTGIQHHQAHGATGNRIASGAAHQGTGEGVLPFRPRDGDRHAHRARLHDGQRGKKARHLPLHGEHPHPPCVRENRNPQALRADRLH